MNFPQAEMRPSAWPDGALIHYVDGYTDKDLWTQLFFTEHWQWGGDYEEQPKSGGFLCGQPWVGYKDRCVARFMLQVTCPCCKDRILERQIALMAECQEVE